MNASVPHAGTTRFIPSYYGNGSTIWLTSFPVITERFSNDARAEATRLDLLTCIEETKHHIVPITEDDIDYVVEKGRKDAARAWARAIGQYREYLRDTRWWKGTYVDRALNPPNGPPLPNKLPRPVYVSKLNPDLVIELLAEFVNLYTKVASVVVPAA
jgi:hypothetical protein